jgi:hypothetical protein
VTHQQPHWRTPEDVFQVQLSPFVVKRDDQLIEEAPHPEQVLHVPLRTEGGLDRESPSQHFDLDRMDPCWARVVVRHDQLNRFAGMHIGDTQDANEAAIEDGDLGA